MREGQHLLLRGGLLIQLQSVITTRGQTRSSVCEPRATASIAPSPPQGSLAPAVDQRFKDSDPAADCGAYEAGCRSIHGHPSERSQFVCRRPDVDFTGSPKASPVQDRVRRRR